MAGVNNWREEMVIEEAARLNLEVLGKGWPDFLMYHKETDSVVLVEVKASSKGAKEFKDKYGLSPTQKRMHQLLKKLGLKVIVVTVGRSNKNKEKIQNQLNKAFFKK